MKKNKNKNKTKNNNKVQSGVCEEKNIVINEDKSNDLKENTNEKNKCDKTAILEDKKKQNIEINNIEINNIEACGVEKNGDENNTPNTVNQNENTNLNKKQTENKKKLLLDEEEIESVRDYDTTSYEAALAMEDNNEKEKKRFDIEKKEIHEKFPFLAIQTVISVVLALATIVFLLLAVYYRNQSLKMQELDLQIEGLKGQLEIEKENNNELNVVIQELTEKNDILSGTVNSKSDSLSEMEMEKQLKKIPDNYPLKGSAGIIDKENYTPPEDEIVYYTDESGNEISYRVAKHNIEFDNQIPSVRFMCDSQTKVVATGDGIVYEIEEGAYGEYSIMVDHENEYVSGYHGCLVPLVSEGDFVSKGSVIAIINESNSEFEYTITSEGEYIDPMSIMIING